MYPVRFGETSCPRVGRRTVRFHMNRSTLVWPKPKWPLLSPLGQGPSIHCPPKPPMSLSPSCIHNIYSYSRGSCIYLRSLLLYIFKEHYMYIVVSIIIFKITIKKNKYTFLLSSCTYLRSIIYKIIIKKIKYM